MSRTLFEVDLSQPASNMAVVEVPDGPFGMPATVLRSNGIAASRVQQFPRFRVPIDEGATYTFLAVYRVVEPNTVGGKNICLGGSRRQANGAAAGGNSGYSYVAVLPAIDSGEWITIEGSVTGTVLLEGTTDADHFWPVFLYNYTGGNAVIELGYVAVKARGGRFPTATKAADQVTLQVLPTPNNVRLYYLKQASNLAAPAKPTANPPASPWTTTEPTYTEGSTDTVYTTMLTVWGDASYQYGDVQKSAAFEAAKQAFNKADSAATVAANLRTAIDLGLMRTGKASSPPAVGKGLTWAVLDELTGKKVSGLRIANAAGTAWTPYQLIAEDLMVVGAGGTVRLKNGVVDADVILANDALYKKLATSEFWATLATVENLVVTSKMLGNEIEGKVFKGGLVRGAKVETDALTVGPQVQTETYQTLWESNFNADTTGWAGILGTIARVTTPVYEGAGSLRITYTYPKKMVAAEGLAIPAQVGDVISAWVRTPSAGGYAYIAYYQQQENRVLRYMGNPKPLPANTWVQLENSVSMPGIIEGLEVVFDETVGSLVYVDLVQVLRPQTSIGAARFTISDGGAALLTTGGKSIVVEDLIDAVLLGPNEMRIDGTVYQKSGTLESIPQTPAFSQFGSTYARTITIDMPFTPPSGWIFRWFVRKSNSYTTVERGGTSTQIRIIQVGSNDVNALSSIGWELVKI